MSKQPFVTRNGNVLSFKKGNLSGRVKAVAADEYDAGGIEAVVNELASQLAALKEENERLNARVAELEKFVKVAAVPMMSAIELARIGYFDDPEKEPANEGDHHA